jgi:hypothetical protein
MLAPASIGNRAALRIEAANPLSSAAKLPQSLQKSVAKMRWPRLVPIALAAILMTRAVALSDTLGDPKVGFSAERVLVFDGQRYIGHMWSMPGRQRHEQVLPAISPVFILRADSAIGDIVLPSLHTVVEFALPKVLAALNRPDLLGRPVGEAIVNGIATTRFAVDKSIPEGHLSGALWLGRDGIPMRADGRFTDKNGRVSTVHWELRHVRLGNQQATLFEVPPGYAKISPQAAATLLGLHLAPRAANRSVPSPQ